MSSVHIHSFRGRESLGAAALALSVLTGWFHHRYPVNPSVLEVDPAGSGVFEAGTTTAVEPTWRYYQQPSSTGCPARRAAGHHGAQRARIAAA